GGDGTIRSIEFLDSMTASILANHRRIAPFGLCGGEAGRVGINRVIRRDGSVEELPATASVSVSAGDVFVIETPGGGGYGREVVSERLVVSEERRDEKG
ncbi:MAG: hydantoinase B/oxoprolinase family protein, partial [Gemmatimonadetes bacterium]|nr:hydantoinase B/oxoprolinase family protein [Gemmatimonadota bacterium]